MADIDFGKQIGPLPLGAWVVTIGAGVGIAFWARSRNTVPDEYVETSGVPGVGVGGSGVYTELVPVVSQGDSVSLDTPNAWGNAAIKHLIAAGYDAATADSAIRKYLYGGELSTREYALIGIAIGGVGPAPAEIPAANYSGGGNSGGGTSNPQPSSDPVSPPTSQQFRYVTVSVWPSKNSTLWGIAETVYGNGQRWRDIYNANRAGSVRADGTPGMISNPNLIIPGWKVLIP